MTVPEDWTEIVAPRSKHSRKEREFAKLIEIMGKEYHISTVVIETISEGETKFLFQTTGRMTAIQEQQLRRAIIREARKVGKIGSSLFYDLLSFLRIYNHPYHGIGQTPEAKLYHCKHGNYAVIMNWYSTIY
jgi:hypothetical protein